jgi:hypothetical protein
MTGVSFPLTRAQCPALATTPALQAQMVVEGLEATPCELTVTQTPQGEYSADGRCEGVPVGKKRLVTLRWYVQAPVTKKQILLAEASGSAPLETASSPELTVTFDPALSPVTKPKVRASVSDPASEKDRFNCDRGGQFGAGDSPCDSTQTLTQIGADKDTCSNLEELCKGTLFSATDDNDCGT